MEEEALLNLRVELVRDDKLRTVFEAIPYNNKLGYCEISRKCRVSGIHLDEALAMLITLNGIKIIRQDEKVLSDRDYYLRLVKFSDVYEMLPPVALE